MFEKMNAKTVPMFGYDTNKISFCVNQCQGFHRFLLDFIDCFFEIKKSANVDHDIKLIYTIRKSGSNFVTFECDKNRKKRKQIKINGFGGVKYFFQFNDIFFIIFKCIVPI